jgi:hypothetical protein
VWERALKKGVPTTSSGAAMPWSVKIAESLLNISSRRRKGEFQKKGKKK